ncbi:hypothetical protein OC834_005499 [Tilletia horrida]|nr:hypothetical protein OC834_005499 [Tilletia horrida]
MSAASTRTKRPASEDAGAAASSSSSSSSSGAGEQPQQKRHKAIERNGNSNGSGGQDQGQGQGQGQNQPAARAPKPVSSVYVSNLPLDATQEELASVFSRYGVLLEDDSGSAANRIKLYRDSATDMFTGDALITYFKPESVELAVNVLDESCLRAHLGQREPVMRVRRAEFGKDKEKGTDSGSKTAGKDAAPAKKSQAPAAPPQASSSAGGSSTSFGAKNDAAPADKGDAKRDGNAAGRRQLTDAEKKKVQKRMARLQSKLDGWESDSDGEGPGPGIINSTTTSTGAPGQISTVAGDLSAVDPALASSRTVVLTKMFTLAELDEDPALLLDLKEEVREECETLGKVTNVILYDKEPEGIMSIKFADVLGARACKMNNRYFAGRTISAFLSHGKPRYRRTGVRGPDELGDDDDAGDDEESKRKDAFGAWLDGGGDDDGESAATGPVGDA